MRALYCASLIALSVSLTSCSSNYRPTPKYNTLDSPANRTSFADTDLGQSVQSFSNVINGDLKKAQTDATNALSRASESYLPPNTKLGKIDLDENIFKDLYKQDRQSNSREIPKQGLSFGYKF